MRTVIGSAGDDVLNGNVGLDLIEGGDGNDTLYGWAKRDTLIGGDGDDRIFTGAGPDLAYGGAGNDLIVDHFNVNGVEIMYGGSGDDTIRGGTSGFWQLGYPKKSDWWMFGEAGDDFLIAGRGGTSHMFGGSGNDTIEMSGYGNGEAYGGHGDDLLVSYLREDPEYIDKYSFSDNVTLDGGAGNDRLFGYLANNDTFVFQPGGGRDVVHNFDGGTYFGVDRIDLTAFEFDMTAEEVFAMYGHEQQNRILLNFGADSKLIINDTDYMGGIDIMPEDVIRALIL